MNGDGALMQARKVFDLNQESPPANPRPSGPFPGIEKKPPGLIPGGS